MFSSEPFVTARRKMVDDQLVARGIHDARVLAAFRRVPRERFVATGFEAEAYADRALPIDCNQTISQPYIVALMTQALALRGPERVLEIGTGSGYQTAILAELAAEVVTIERHASLSRGAQTVLNDLGMTNVEFLIGDGRLGWPDRAPYDAILIAAAAEQVPPALFSQLADGGRLVAPLGGDQSQNLELIFRGGDRFSRQWLSGCRFVPLVGGGPPPG